MFPFPHLNAVMWRHGDPPMMRTSAPGGIWRAMPMRTRAPSVRRHHTSPPSRVYVGTSPPAASSAHTCSTADANTLSSSRNHAWERAGRSPFRRSIEQMATMVVPMPSKQAMSATRRFSILLRLLLWCSSCPAAPGNRSLTLEWVARSCPGTGSAGAPRGSVSCMSSAARRSGCGERRCWKSADAWVSVARGDAA